MLVEPDAMFAVETKSHRGRIGVDRLDPQWLKQAYAERKLLERITGMRVEALLVFSDAYLVGSVPARRMGDRAAGADAGLVPIAAQACDVR